MRPVSKRWTRGALMPAAALVVGARPQRAERGPARSTAAGGGRSVARHRQRSSGRRASPSSHPEHRVPWRCTLTPMKLATVSQVARLPAKRRISAGDGGLAMRLDTPVLMFDDVQLSFEVRLGERQDPREVRGPGQGLRRLSGDDPGRARHGCPRAQPSASNDEVLMVKDGAAIRLLARGDVPIGAPHRDSRTASTSGHPSAADRDTTSHSHRHVSAFGSELSPTWLRPFRAKEQVDRLTSQARELSERSAPAGVVRPAKTRGWTV